jgi:hypothetical protein
MRYMLLIYGDEQAAAGATPEQTAAIMQAWYRYTNELEQAGHRLAGEPLQPSTTATTVRGGSGGPLVSDGPFAETKEQLGGYYLIEAADLDEAIAWAARMPHVPHGGIVEVRPIFELPTG